MGLGHIIRSLALAEMLCEDFECHFIVRNPLSTLKKQILEICETIIELPETKNDIEEAEYIAKQYLTNKEIVVLDGYHFVTEYQRLIKSKARKLVCIDDIYAYHFVADAIINHAGGVKKEDYSVESYTQIYLGLSYLLLRKPFREAIKNGINKTYNKNVLICLGGADPKNDTLKVIQHCITQKPNYNYYIIVGSAYLYRSELEKFVVHSSTNIEILSNLSAVQMVECMQKCGKAITPPSTISFEYLSIGGELYLKTIADNQKGIFNYLIANNLALKFDEQTTLIEKPFDEEKIKIIDGKQKKRFIKMFYHLLVTLRKATTNDIMLYYQWTNETETRKQSFNSTTIPLASHKNWFQQKIEDKNTLMLLAQVASNMVGQVRFDLKDKKIYIGYSIDKNYRGKGLGEIILKEGIKKAKDYFGMKTPIIGYVKKQNIPSTKIFRNLGFSETEAELYENAFKYVLK